jgi:hypothetical protein
MNIPIFMEEPTTAAAFFLTTPEYHEQLARIREDIFQSKGHGSQRADPSAQDHLSGAAHTHTSSRSDAQAATPRSTTGEVGTPLVGSPTQSNNTDLYPDILTGAHLDSASQHERQPTYHDDSLSATGSIPTAPSPSYAAAEHQVRASPPPTAVHFPGT